MNKKVGFIGLGNMGRPMAQRLLQAGFELMVYDINPKALQAMVDLGAQEASSILDLAGACDRILLSLPGSADVEKVTLGEGGIIAAAEPGTVVIDTTTANPLSTRRVAGALATKDIEMLDAPVDGGVMDCESGTLSMMVGGKKEVFEQYRPLLSKITPKSLNYIGDIGSGHVLKLASITISLTNRWAVSEGMVLAARAGLSCEKVLEIVNVSTGRSANTATFPRYFLKGQLLEGFTIGMACKGLDLATEFARDLGVPFFVGNKTQNLYHNLMGKWGPEQDVTDTVKRMEDWVGVKVRRETNL